MISFIKYPGCDILSTTEVVIMHQSEQPLRFEEELSQDVLEIITVFCARLYGSRSHQNRKLIERLRQAAKEIGRPCLPTRPSWT